MADGSEAMTRYWRTNLADSAFAKGKFKGSEREKLRSISAEELQRGQVSDLTVGRMFASKPTSLRALSVRLRPVLAKRRYSHAADRHDGLPEYVAPIITEAVLGRDGRLHPRRTVIARDVLEPLPEGAFSIGTVSRLDTFLSTSSVLPRTENDGYTKSWRTYRERCLRMLSEVANGWPKSDCDYEVTGEGLIEEGEETSQTIRKILGLYDHILKEKPDAPLLRRFATGQMQAPIPVLPQETDFAKRLAHSNDGFPLAPRQRDVLAHLAVAKEGEVVAVNGPPGTGKTTMLLSAIASEWAKAALEGAAPPVIVAASSNNQAVTNIINAFRTDFAKGQGPFAGRWLPDINSFGLFLPAQSREAEAAKTYQTESFFRKIETPDYVRRAQQSYLAAAQNALPQLRGPDIEHVVSALRDLIEEEIGRLAATDAVRVALSKARTSLTNELGTEPMAAHAARKARHDLAASEHAGQRQGIERWEEYLAGESILLSLFKFLPPVAEKRALRARLFLRQQGDDMGSEMDLKRVEGIDAKLRQRMRTSDDQLRGPERDLARATRVLADYDRARGDWLSALRLLGVNTEDADDIGACDQQIDCTIRFKIFLLTTHYWEGRWLIDMQKALSTIEADRSKTGRKTVEPRWRRRMMLTPCAVATFSTLPEKMSVTSFANGNYLDGYLYNFIDLLIVDEAGQVLPEVAGASFALARRALVIGDTQQIEPISSVPKAVDIGNMRESGILPADYDEATLERLEAIGVTSSAGSAMRVAQVACQYHPYADLERGLYLFEHRRCYDEIISFCNALCYKGTLQPKRGSSVDDAPLSPMGYLHIDGFCAAVGGSRHNLLEAQTIAAWLVANRQRLEQHYKLPLEEIVGVITPFGAQVREIARACRKKGIVVGSADNEMTVGTVHSLQGAERRVVIFSPAYSKHADGSFIDTSASMLNVAVSRAKDSFLVFGDMDCFSTARPGSPRAVLASFLFAKPANGLEFEIQPRSDLLGGESRILTLQDAEQHDKFLLEVLAGDARQIHIVSPWIITSTMERAGILDALRQARLRGVKIQIYVDPALNGIRDPADDVTVSAQLEDASSVLQEIEVKLIHVSQLHSKLIMVDERLLCVGSFNWLSAQRSGKYVRHETSIVYRGEHLEKEIAVIKNSLATRIR